ncbi:MAG TPA: helix-turn-helix transcriptional regulator [Pyrinomonadaceae bacterium]|nr:helix-turn-helix transcriptional regulator [Pyrinomonadaceae bacterium]
MAKPFKILRDRMSPEARQLSKKMADEMRSEIRLTELRSALGVSQEELAQLMKKKQAAISRFERRSDMHISTLREFISALGGRLQVIASFPDGSYHISQFEDEK